MPRRIVDISVALKAGIVSDPPYMLPKIEYVDHDAGAAEMVAAFPGLDVEQLPERKGWAIERARITTHNGTHMDAPWHYHPTTEGGRRAATIDEIPLVLQYNKRDLTNIAPINYLEYVLNNRKKRFQSFEVISSTGQNVFAALNAVSQILLHKFSKQSDVPATVAPPVAIPVEPQRST